MAVRAGSGTYACDLVYATNMETKFITHEPTKNEARIFVCIRVTPAAPVFKPLLILPA